MKDPRQVLLVLVLSGLSVGPSLARELTFEERVRAQEALERVYHSHQLGVSRSFEASVPRAVLEQKVRRSLQLTQALETYWNTPVTAEMLQRELERIARDSRMPERLAQLYAALGQDGFLLQECLARAVLVERLTGRFFAADERIHGQARSELESLHAVVGGGAIERMVDHPRARRVKLVSGEPSAPDNRQALTPEELEDRKRSAESWPGGVGEISETAEAFFFDVLIEQEPNALVLATFSVPKVTWQEWWQENAPLYEGAETTVTAVASPGTALRLPSNVEGTTCFPDHTWANGSLSAEPDPVPGVAVWTGSLMLKWGGIPARGIRYDPATDSFTLISSLNAPAGRTQHTSVWTGSELIVWGGLLENIYTNDYLEASSGGRYDPATDTWTTMSNLQARSDHAAVWTGTEMIVWGGRARQNLFHPYTTTYLTTGGRYNPATNTWVALPTTNAPTGRIAHAAVWTGEHMVVWGGSGSSGNSIEGKRYVPATNQWLSLSTGGQPTPRTGHTAIWTGDRMIVWGGTSGGLDTNTGARYDPWSDQWASMSTPVIPRTFHSAVWTGNRMIVWGGSWSGANVNSGAQYDPASNSWTPTSSVNAPVAGSGYGAVWTGSLMVVWGADTPGGRYEPVSNSWTPTFSNDPVPAKRRRHSAVWTGNSMITFGGLGPTTTALASGDRYDPATDSWSSISTVAAPVARYSHVAAWTGDEMLIWGGAGGAGSGARYDAAADSWTPMSSEGPSSGSLVGVWTGDTLLVFGGSPFAGGQYDPATDDWQPVAPAPIYPDNFGFSVVWTGSRALVWGGYSGINTGAQYDPASDVWTGISEVNAPSGRYEHSAHWIGDSMLIWGGKKTGEGTTYTGGRYDPALDTWTPMSTLNAPLARASAPTVWSGSEMLVWGGYQEVLAFFYHPDLPTPFYYPSTGVTPGPGGAYNPATDSWTSMAAARSPVLRNQHSAVWTGSSMIVWGGSLSTSESGANAKSTDTGGQYMLGHASNDDDDGDGLSECDGECNDGDPAVQHGPTEVTAVALDAGHPTSIHFASQDATGGSSTAYHLVMGNLGELLASGGFSQASCLGSFADTPAVDTSSNPPVGEGYYYLVRASNPCGAGDYGTDSDGLVRVVTACP